MTKKHYCFIIKITIIIDGLGLFNRLNHKNRKKWPQNRKQCYILIQRTPVQILLNQKQLEIP